MLYIGGIYEKNLGTGEVTKHYMADGRRIAMRKGASLYYFANDHLGSTSLVMDSSGNMVSQTRYYPYGNVWTQGVSATPQTDKLFTGQRRYGANSGIYYYGSRFYSADIGRFLQPDTIVPGAESPQALNRYSYVVNNPMKYTDPTGHCFGEAPVPCPSDMPLEEIDQIEEEICCTAGNEPLYQYWDIDEFDPADIPLYGGGVKPANAARAAGLGWTIAVLGGGLALEGLKHVDTPDVTLPSTWFSGGDEETEYDPEALTTDEAEGFTEAQLEKVENQLDADGVESLKKSLRSLERRLEENKELPEDYKKINAPSSYIEGRIRAHQGEINAIKHVLKKWELE